MLSRVSFVFALKMKDLQKMIPLKTHWQTLLFKTTWRFRDWQIYWQHFGKESWLFLKKRTGAGNDFRGVRNLTPSDIRGSKNKRRELFSRFLWRLFSKVGLNLHAQFSPPPGFYHPPSPFRTKWVASWIKARSAAD